MEHLNYNGLNPIEEYYTDDMYGGHLSVKGNEVIAGVLSGIVADLLKEKTKT
jgi:hypothetical protein